MLVAQADISDIPPKFPCKWKIYSRVFQASVYKPREVAEALDKSIAKLKRVLKALEDTPPELSSISI